MRHINALHPKAFSSGAFRRLSLLPLLRTQPHPPLPRRFRITFPPAPFSFFLSLPFFSLAKTMTNENTPSAVVHATDESFQEDVLKADKPVLVDFWAPWCGPCKAIAPLLEELAQERSDVRIVKVNIDEHSKMATQYNVRAIPTLLLFKGGELSETVVGAVRKPELEKLLNA